MAAPGRRRGTRWLGACAALAVAVVGGGAALVATAGPSEASGSPGAGVRVASGQTFASSHLDNPFVGAVGYVDPGWRSKVLTEPGGERIAGTPTGIWVEKAAAIKDTGGGMGLRDHLDAALAQKANLVQLILNDLPARECAPWSSHGDVPFDDIDGYRAGFIDPIAAIVGDPAYSQLRIVVVIEVGALPQLITGGLGGGRRVPAGCQDAWNSSLYIKGIQYALNRLHPIPNVYTYLDAASYSRVGWSDIFTAVIDLLRTVARGSGGGIDSVDGIGVNIGGYNALREPNLRVDSRTRGTRWVDWNQYVDELSFAQAFRRQMIDKGFPERIGVIIDTSRNGWGGPNRPTKPGISANIDTWVDQTRVDRRIHAGNWCNQVGAGLGERPRPEPAPGIDAYVWGRAPGTSDGSAVETGAVGAALHETMCEPAYQGNPGNANNLSGAMAGAPDRGAWFPAQLRELMANAYPAL